ncbi:MULTISPECIES: bifunctional UDP-N-acetylglucosamine diphosphorylase/glucosamine-1-phosphate N-acetyltransferase GlmU [unclassified Paenibacillus]|uniref:bifunctional UDP-N-acetylglucosamine diphosphorylase/glucosamine-1-phosphate N-acetyltransferase GlmU n=1 Tax=unclassified Paenibacillus TaxID=185978 RepID=UPI000710AF13|nr:MULTISPECIES: bifunctional UDP-N-acetylglucosamine diphosphorylase/glucosamine-1-phosphate N-acetyltransferase GlmU [unclassified Paenibacillus]KQX57734.1 bifunctional N-acetylglucosamine-1-phosphate uridyltransferase/glucosamine-1-phosphate acetyltransferase [Paenibacillus sp. Root444D2]KRE45428.1 bifunctional N-acetylglucosamine-1-phosphate uridyltransferase/glucosamine-1-phosphate acetyltransferase [Paenibacillus sp. Soil724D2]
MKLMGIVLAAGQGKRMKSKLYKVLHPVVGKPMVEHVVDTLQHIEVTKTLVIVGFGAEAVKGHLGDRVEYALQEQQLGTGHAVLQAKDALGEEEGMTVVICGDTPLISEATLMSTIELHELSGASATILTAKLDEPHGYGRIIRGEDGRVARIVEQKDCSSEEAAVQEINTGTYIFDNRKLFKALASVTNNNTQNEYYLTDVIGIMTGGGEVVQGYCMEDSAESIGVNDRVALAEAERLFKARINREHMLNGVTIVDPLNTYIEKDVTIGMDTVLLPGTILRGRTVIGEQCTIGPQTEIIDSTIRDEVTIKQSVLQDAYVDNEASVGPFAYLRPGANIGKQVKIGDFVEIKNATLGEGSKVSHLSYVGDAVVGTNVNIGCGAITVNYDGFNKSLTEIGDDAFVGSNVNLIAPVKIGKGAYVVAGSTITHSVDDGDLAIARERQSNKSGYADKIRARAKAKKENKQNKE